MACCSCDDHEYCCDCYSAEERVVAIINDVLSGEWRFCEPQPDDQAEAIRLALTLEDAL